MGQSESNLREIIECTARQCELSKEVSKGLGQESIIVLRNYARKHGISCASTDARLKANWCEVIAQEVERKRMDMLLKLAMNFCERIAGARQSAEQSAAFEHTLTQMGIDKAEFATDFDRCSAMTSRFRTIIKDLKRLKESSTKMLNGLGQYASIQRALLGTLLFFASSVSGKTVDTVTSEVCSFAPHVKGLASPSICQLDLPTSTKTQYQRFWTTKALISEVSSMSFDMELIKQVRTGVYTNLMSGIQSQPTATFLLGGASIRKRKIFRKVVLSNKILQVGICGAINLNSDNIMEDLPGYRTMLALGEYAAANMYYTPAKIIMKSLLFEAKDGQQSVVFDGTGNNQAHLERRMQEFKSAGFLVNVIAEAMPNEMRMNRVNDQKTKMRQYVPAKVVQEDKSENEWLKCIQNWISQGKIDFGKVYMKV
jgi:hypothetical protein